AFTVYFAIIESTLLVEALRVDHAGIRDRSSCHNCANSAYPDLPDGGNVKQKRSTNGDSEEDIHVTGPQHVSIDMRPTVNGTTSLTKSFSLVNKNPPFHSTTSYYIPSPHLKSISTVQQTSSAPPFIAPIRPIIRSTGDIEVTPTVSLGSIELTDQPKWKPDVKLNPHNSNHPPSPSTS
ncbi:hypothetical protein BJ944DRAFT_276637, partial [Cunninghamella echinulata]